MKQNVGRIDKMVRLIIAIVFIFVGYYISPWFYIVSVVMILTALMGFCGIYALLGINTVKKK